MPSRDGKRVKVVHFVECWLPQTEIWLYKHVRSLPEWVESCVVCQWTRNLDQFPEPNLFSSESPPTPASLLQRVGRRLGWWDDGKRHLPLLEEVIQNLKPDILHSHFGHFGWINSTLARKYNLRHVVSFYGFDVGYLPTTDRRWISRYRQMSDLADLVLCEGPHMARCIADLGLEPKKVKVLRLGIDLDRVPFVPRKNIGGGPLRFLIAGSFREKKGIPYALEALGLFSRNYPNIEITVIGDVSGDQREEREKRRILEQVQRWGLDEKTRFLGYQPHEFLIREFYRHDIFLSPSVTSSEGDTEGGAPVAIIEAAASGMCVISTQHCDIPFVLSEGNKPYLVPERDSMSLCQAIEALIHCEDWTQLLTANRELIEAELDVRRQAGKLADLYGWVSGRAPIESQEGHGRSLSHAHL